MTDDVPYLEPLLFWLRNDPDLKEEFTEKSFFMPHSDLISAAEEAMRKDCPAPRALWILPQDTLAVSPKANCHSPGRHTFYITVFVQCIRDSFQLVKRDSQVKLDGQFMELSRLRKLIKKSVLQFSKERERTGQIRSFGDMTWIKDQMMYPDEGQFLATAIEYEVTIY